MPRQATYVAAHRVPGPWLPVPIWPTHPPHAIGTRGPLGDQITSIEASFDFSPRSSPRPLKYPHVRPQGQAGFPEFWLHAWYPLARGNFATASRRESDPLPPARSRRVQRDSSGPRSQIASDQEARNSNLRLGGPPRHVPRLLSEALHLALHCGYSPIAP